MAHPKSEVSEFEAVAPHDQSVDNHTGLRFDNAAVLLELETTESETGISHRLKVSKNGHTILVPQPSEDPKDPLNWPQWKKHMILLTAALSGFCAEFNSGAGIPATFSQAAEWGKHPNTMVQASNINVLAVGLGSILWVPCSRTFGRAPTMFWSMLIGTLFTLAAPLAPSLGVFYLSRIMGGLFLSPGNTLGLVIIEDIFFFHEHARKIGLWLSIYLCAPFLSPLLGSFIIAGTGDWRALFWVTFAICCLEMLLIALFMDETWYDRSEAPPRASRAPRLMLLLGLSQIQKREYCDMSPKKSFFRLISILWKPIVPPVLLAQAMVFMWMIGINVTAAILFQTPTSDGGYGFSLKGMGFLYFTPVVSIWLGEGFGHVFNDFVVRLYARRHKGLFVPEVRLWTCYAGGFLAIPGLVLVGLALQDHLHYSAIIIGWGMTVTGVLIVTVAINAYLSASYPSGAGEVAGYLIFARCLGGFSIGYFQQSWGARVGYGASFGTQAAVVAAALTILGILHKFGNRIRTAGGPLRW